MSAESDAGSRDRSSTSVGTTIRADRAGPSLSPGLLAGALSVMGAVLLAAWVGRDTWFFSDDWNILAEYHDSNLLEPFNGHLSLVPAGLYRIVFETFGTGSYLPFRLIGLGSLGVLGYQVLRFCAARLSALEPSRTETGAWFAALAVTAVLWNPSGDTNLMFPFLANFSLPIAALVAIWWHLDVANHAVESGRTSPVRNEVAASLWLAVAVGSSGLGVMALAAVLVEVVIGRASWRRVLILSPAPVLWAVWFFTNAGSNAWSTDPGAVVSYSARMLWGATTSLAGGWKVGGVLVLVALGALLCVAALRWRSLDARAWAALVAPAAFIGSTAVTRLEIEPLIPPDETRYAWTIAAYLVLFVVIVWRSDAALERSPLRWALTAVAVLAVLVGAVRLVDSVREWTAMVVDARPKLVATLQATELLGSDGLGADRVMPLSFVPVTVNGYLDAVAHVGSPVEGLALRADPNGLDADLMIIDALRAEGVPTSQRELTCAEPTAPSTGPIEAPAGTTVRVTPVDQEAPVEILLSRFAPAQLASPLVTHTEGPLDIALPDDLDTTRGASLPYNVLTSAPVSFELCR